MMSIVQVWLFPTLFTPWLDRDYHLPPPTSPPPPALPFHHLVIMTLTPYLYLDTQIGVDGIDEGWESWEGQQGFILSTVSFSLQRLSGSGGGK